MIRMIGWDIGGANVKAARILFTDGRAENGRTVRRYFELWNNSGGLHPLLREIYSDLGPADAMVVTMTGELCDAFDDRAEGVASIIDAVRETAPEIPLYAVDLEGSSFAWTEVRWNYSPLRRQIGSPRRWCWHACNRTACWWISAAPPPI